MENGDCKSAIEHATAYIEWRRSGGKNAIGHNDPNDTYGLEGPYQVLATCKEREGDHEGALAALVKVKLYSASSLKSLEEGKARQRAENAYKASPEGIAAAAKAAEAKEKEQAAEKEEEKRAQYERENSVLGRFNKQLDKQLEDMRQTDNARRNADYRRDNNCSGGDSRSVCR